MKIEVGKGCKIFWFFIVEFVVFFGFFKFSFIGEWFILFIGVEDCVFVSLFFLRFVVGDCDFYLLTVGFFLYDKEYYNVWIGICRMY